MLKLRKNRARVRRIPVRIVKKSYGGSRALYYRISADDLLQCLDPVTDPGPFPDNQAKGPYEKTFEYGGDHVYCETASGPWGIRLGRRQNPIIRLQPGMVLARPFDRITIYCMEQPELAVLNVARTGTLWPGYFTIFVSSGPLVLHPGFRPYGFGTRSVGACDVVASTTPEYITSVYQAPAPDQQPHFPGRDGSILMLRNADLSNTLFLVSMQDSTAPGVFEEQWRLLPGECLSIPLDGSIVGRADRKIGLGVKTRAGTCKFDWYISRMTPESGPQDRDNFGFSLPPT